VGSANIMASMVGGQGGAAILGGSVLMCQNGASGRYRISTVVCAFTLLMFVLVAGPLVELFPTASLIGVMFYISSETFVWQSIPMVISAFTPQQIRRHIPAMRHYKMP
jgi:sulfate permease, SulP family